MTSIENAINGLTATVSAELNPDGTLKNNSVSTAAIQDRAVTLVKLAFLSSFWAVDAGAVNAMAITFTPPLTVYTQGLVFWVKALASNTGPTTINVDGLGVKAVKKFTFGGGTIELVAGEITAGNACLLVYDGTRFLLLNPTPPAIAGSIQMILPALVKNFVAPAVFADVDISALVPLTTRLALLYCSGQAVEGGAAAQACQFQTSLRSDPLGDVYQGLLLTGGNIGGTPISFPMTGQFWVRVIVAGGTVKFQAQLLQTVVGNTDSVSENVYLIGYSI